MTSFVSHPHNCKSSLPLNSYRMFLFPTDGSLSAMNYKQVHMPNLKESKFPDKNHVLLSVFPRSLRQYLVQERTKHMLKQWITGLMWMKTAEGEDDKRGGNTVRIQHRKRRRREKKKLVKAIIFVRVSRIFFFNLRTGKNHYCATNMTAISAYPFTVIMNMNIFKHLPTLDIQCGWSLIVTTIKPTRSWVIYACSSLRSTTLCHSSSLCCTEPVSYFNGPVAETWKISD